MSSLRAVEHQQLARLDPLARVVQSDDGRDLERACEDGRVIRAAPCIGDETANPGPVHLGRERRGQLVGHQDRCVIDPPQQIPRRRDAVPEVHAQPPHQIGDVAFPLPQVGVGHLVEYRAEFLKHLLDRPLGVHALGADDVGGPRHEHGIVDHQELGIEERRHLGAPAPHALADLGQLFARPRAARLEPAELVLEARGRDVIPQHLGALDENDGPARHDAGRHADALQAHISSPNPDRTNDTSASTAARSSAPSALIVIVEPRAAASSRMPMMLLPSISRCSRATRTRDS
jgi:hypothetical protein